MVNSGGTVESGGDFGRGGCYRADLPDVMEGVPVNKDKVAKTMHEFKHGTLHSGSKTGPKVQSRAQAIAIALNQARKGKK